MNGTRIEILKNEIWTPVFLSSNEKLKFNVVINKIGETSKRELSHSNTVSLINDWNTIQALDLNLFNKRELAIALNKRYVAKYYIKSKIAKIGYLVINNTNAGKINVNFIGEGLSLTEQWGSITFQELLRSSSLAIPGDYQTAIDELRNFNINPLGLISPTSFVAGRGYKLCYFPNNLNTIGEKFQLDANELRIDNRFNSFQSRPLFNAKALFDLGTEAFGYTSIYDPSIDWSVVNKTIIVSPGLGTSEKDDTVGTLFKNTQSGTVSSYRSVTHVAQHLGRPLYQTRFALSFSTEVGIKPSNISNFTTPALGDASSALYFNSNTVYVPEQEAGLVGSLTVQADYSYPAIITQEQAAGTAFEYQSIHVVGIWKKATHGGGTVSDVRASSIVDASNNTDGGGAFEFIRAPVDTNLTRGIAKEIDITFNKSIFSSPPVGGAEFIGFQIITERFYTLSPHLLIPTSTVSEGYFPSGVITYDEFGQYNPASVDLTHGASTETVKSLISSIMHKEGILMSISDVDKTVKFFSYGAYETAKDAGDFEDWSDYFIKYSIPEHSTNYGNNYAKKNEIGLQSPFPGNTSNIFLDNQGDTSKYKDFVQNLSNKFKDIESVVSVNNTNVSFLEFTNKGLGLVEYEGPIGGVLTQSRADGSTQGAFNYLSKISNVNGAVVSQGVREWYKLVDEALRIDAQFALPVSVFTTFDVSKPIYVNKLHGFYIVEEISEYTDGVENVTVKLIKLIDNLKE